MAPEFKHLLMEVNEGIAVVTVNRPRVLNALSDEVTEDFVKLAEYLEVDTDIKVAIIKGAGDKAFVAGADIGGFEGTAPLSMINNRMQYAFNLLENGSTPIIAAINGFALGGGLELALACDIRIVADNAIVGLPETGLGLIPGAGGTQRLARVAGISVAKDLIISGRKLNAQEAVQFGIASRVVPKENLMDEAMKVAKEITKRAPLAVALGKKAVNVSLDLDMNHGLMIETLYNMGLFTTEDLVEGSRAFLEKRKPNFQGK